MTPAEIELTKYAIQYIGVPLVGALIGWFTQRTKTKKAHRQIEKERKMKIIVSKNVEKFSKPDENDKTLRADNIVKYIKLGTQADMERAGLEEEFNKTIKEEVDLK